MKISEIIEKSEDFKYFWKRDIQSVGGSHKSGGYCADGRRYLAEASWSIPVLDRVSYDELSYKEFIEREMDKETFSLVKDNLEDLLKVGEKYSNSWMSTEDMIDLVKDKEMGRLILSILSKEEKEND